MKTGNKAERFELDHTKVVVPNVRSILAFATIFIMEFIVLVLVFKKIFISIKNRK